MLASKKIHLFFLYQLEKSLVFLAQKMREPKLLQKRSLYNAKERHTKSLENLNTAGGAEMAFSNSKVLLATWCEWW